MLLAVTEVLALGKYPANKQGVVGVGVIVERDSARRIRLDLKILLNLKHGLLCFGVDKLHNGRALNLLTRSIEYPR